MSSVIPRTRIECPGLVKIPPAGPKHPAMTIAAGTRLGPHEIIAPVGTGGIGEVYRAPDTRLGRDVAVKVLPSSYADNRERLQRFEQEACAAGALNHPNILSFYDIGIVLNWTTGLKQ